MSISMDLAANPLHQNLGVVEDVLNKVGYIPMVGSFSAMGRAMLAKVEIAAGIGLTAIFTLGALFAEAFGKPSAARNFYSAAGRSLSYVGHGLCNSARCLIEFVPFLPLLTTLPYDLSGKRVAYEGE